MLTWNFFSSVSLRCSLHTDENIEVLVLFLEVFVVLFVVVSLVC